jgi:hypothetical protein
MIDLISSRDVIAGGHALRVYESGSSGAVPILLLHGSGRLSQELSSAIRADRPRRRADA